MSYKARFFKLEGTHALSKHFKMKQIWQYRHLSFMDRLTNNMSSKGVLLGQVQGDGSFLKGLIREIQYMKEEVVRNQDWNTLT